MKKKILLLFIGIFAVVFAGFTASVNALSKSTDASEQYLENNWQRVRVANRVHSLLSDYYNITNYYNDTYPEYFGGMYISDDATKLIIQIVEDKIPNPNSEEYSIYSEIINLDNSINIVYVKHSFNELNEANNDIASVFSKNEVSSRNVSSNYIDIMNNSVVVELIDNSQAKQEQARRDISSAKSSVNSNLIRFNQGKENTTHANINAGGQIIAKNNGYCSMAFRVNYNGKNGYLTAGHCVNGVGTTIPSGTVRVRQLSNNQNYDYAFVETNSSYTPTNNLAYTTTGITKLGLINYCPTITVNMAVAKAGRTTGYTSGKVTGLNASVYYSDIGMTIKGMVKTNVYSQPGDSGGAVIIPRTDANGGAIGLGILSGGNDTTMYFSDLNVLPIALQNRY